MVITVHGTVRGRTIELDEDLGVADGKAVEIQVKIPGIKKKPPGPPPGWHPGSTATAAGMMADLWTQEDDGVFEAIHRDRKESSRPETVE